MNYDLEHFSQRLREARTAQNLSQRELGKLAGVPQSHISKIESNQVDLRLSSLIAIANALDLELVLIPRKAMSAVQSIARQTTNQILPAPSGKEPLAEPKPAYTLDEDEP